jgi:hypothetical protein
VHSLLSGYKREARDGGDVVVLMVTSVEQCPFLKGCLVVGLGPHDAVHFWGLGHALKHEKGLYAALRQCTYAGEENSQMCCLARRHGGVITVTVTVTQAGRFGGWLQYICSTKHMIISLI